MDYVIERCAWFCSTKEFKINGIDADWEDFGEKYDRYPTGAETPGGCGKMLFTRTCSTPEILKKYSITESEYSLICDELEWELSFGQCDYCSG
jgi:hypothetical protein